MHLSHAVWHGDSPQSVAVLWLYYCRCQPPTTTTFRPLTAFLTEPTAPELLFMETK
jgi:hypothetical protein